MLYTRLLDTLSALKFSIPVVVSSLSLSCKIISNFYSIVRFSYFFFFPVLHSTLQPNVRFLWGWLIRSFYVGTGTIPWGESFSAPRKPVSNVFVQVCACGNKVFLFFSVPLNRFEGWRFRLLRETKSAYPCKRFDEMHSSRSLSSINIANLLLFASLPTDFSHGFT